MDILLPRIITEGLKDEVITNHEINKTVNDCITVNQVVKRMTAKMKERIVVYLLIIIFYFLVQYAYKSK